MMWMPRALWLFVARDLLDYRYMDDATGNLLSLFCSTRLAVLKMFVTLLNYKKSSQQLPSCVIATRDSLFCKMFSPLFSFEQEKTLKNVSKKLCTSKMKQKKKKQRRKVGLDTQILEQSSEDCCVSVFLLFWSFYKTNKFPVAVGLFSNRSQRTPKYGKNITDTLAAATSLFLQHFDVICDLLLNRRGIIESIC